MPASKTSPTDAQVTAHLASRASGPLLADCETLMALLHRITGQAPRMWGPSIVGCGSYDYRYESGRTGTSALASFAVRGRELVLYLCPGWDAAAPMLDKLGPHKMGKGCLYVKGLAGLDMQVLEQLLRASVDELRRRHGP